MIEESNNIVVAGGDVLVYLGKPMHKKHSTTFVSDHPLSTYISYDRFFFLLPLYTFVHILDDPPPVYLPPPFLQLRTYLMDDLFLNQKTNKNIRILFHWNINIRKKILYEQINIQGSSINENIKKKNIWYCRSVSIYFPYFRTIPVHKYCHIDGIIIVPFNSSLNRCF